jgi:Uma2 family endonuclease
MVEISPSRLADLPLKRWTVDDYHRMFASGILTPEDRVELLDGQIVEMVPQDPPYASRIDDGGDYLKALFTGRAKVRIQLPITFAPGSEPEPDFAIVRQGDDRYRTLHPYPEDVLLLIEVSDSIFKRDRDSKSKIYAGAGIAEYWIVNFKQRQVLVFQNPQDGDYQTEQTFYDQDGLAPLLMPDVTVDLRQLIL